MTAGSSPDIRTISQLASRLLGGGEVRVTPVLGRGSVNKVFFAEGLDRYVGHARVAARRCLA